MLHRIAVERFESWTQVLNYLINVQGTYAGRVEQWEEEISYIIEDDVYKVTVRVKI